MPHHARTPPQAVVRLPANLGGRDFVVGDIHGAYDLLHEALQAVAFDPTKDRLFFVGDLVDRGPASARCLEFLGQPWVHAIAGNHERMLLDLMSDDTLDDDVLEVIAERFKMQWFVQASSEVRREILDAVAQLPYVMEVQTARGNVGLVHAEVPSGMSWPVFLEHIEHGDKKVVQTALWGRSRLESLQRDTDSGVPGIGRVFCGHTPQDNGPTNYGNVFAIDTGAIFHVMNDAQECGLTIAHLAARSVALRDVVRMQPVLVVAEEGEGAFGASYIRPAGEAG